MEEVFQWGKNIVYYMIFSHLILHLMPNGKAEQYMKLFSGTIFILLLTSPLTGHLHLEERLAHVYEQIRFEQEREEIEQQFEQQLWGMENARIEQMMVQYEEAIASDASAIAREEGFLCVNSRAELGRRGDGESFGKVVRISLTLCRENESGEAVSAVSESEQKISAVEEIRVNAGTDEQNGKSAQIQADEQTKTHREQEGVRKVQRKVAEYYGLEEDAVQITWKDD